VTRHLRAELQAIRAVALDLDGVLYERGAPIPGAPEAVAAVRAAGLPVRFVTNTTSRSRRLIAERLGRYGFAVDPHEIVCPARAAAAWLRREDGRAALLVPEAAREDFAGVTLDEAHPTAVVVGDLGDGWTFDALNRAFRLVYEGGAELIGLGRTRFWSGSRGLQLDAGPFLAALEYATGRNARVFGKPSSAFFAALVDAVGVPAAQVAMVGDDILTDVGGAIDAGLVGVLVRTGKFRPRDLDGPVRPHAVLDSVVDLFAG